MFCSGGVMNTSVAVGSGRIWLDEVTCTGNETHLLDCNHAAWGSHNCGHSEDIGCTCGKL